MKPNEQRLVLNIDRGLHTSIKLIATKKHLTIKSWLLLAIAKALNEEREDEERKNKIL